MISTLPVRRRILLQGVVQGVGFRPFVYRIAQRFAIHGCVLNTSAGVVIEAEADEVAIDGFLLALQHELPALARIDSMDVSDITTRGEGGFTILGSVAQSGKFALVPHDIATCPDCRQDFTTAGNRRYGYPFTNCTNCGPRYSIIQDVPYDRSRTTMEEFRMCERCQTEYHDPSNRRFHAEPNACPDCGPSLALVSSEQLASGGPPAFASGRESAAILNRTRHLLRQGQIVAIKGLGGFFLACDATCDPAVARLRERKRRSGKAFAVMVRDLETAERVCHVTDADRRLLTAAVRPIVLLRRRENDEVSGNVAPGNSRLGVMLPYTPLHHLLFDESISVLVMTSGNLSEEPIVSANEYAWPRLGNLAEHFLLHNRKIQTRVDDSVVQTFESREYLVRRSRGYAPSPIDTGAAMHQVLACGGELKNTLCLTKDHYAILSQHIGDLENLETMEFFRETLSHLRRFFRVSPQAVAHDLHPNYLSTRFALEESGLPSIGVQHHHAHIASCMAENGIRERVIGVAFDGTGYGTDGQIWGGEFLVCDFAGFERRAHLRYVPLMGGDSAVRQPWRSALAYLRDAFGAEVDSQRLPLFRDIPFRQIRLVDRMIETGFQTIQTSSCGRLFDAVSSILGIRHETTYEGQAAIELEAIASSACGRYPFELTDGECFEIDLRPAVRMLVQEFLGGVNRASISGRFHLTMAHSVADACTRIRLSDGPNRVCLSGGTFQNLRLLENAVRLLRERGFEVFLHHRVPPNDGGLSLGQAMIANERIS